ncbi:MAG: hypothetical protein WC378_20910, partial [Opitutaceae bacterium]
MLLATFVDTRYLPSRVRLTRDYVNNVRAVVGRFSVAIGRPATLSDLTAENLAIYLTAYAAKWSARSTNNQRQTLLMLWSAAYRMRLVQQEPEGDSIRVLPVEQDPPEAWTFEQVEILF